MQTFIVMIIVVVIIIKMAPSASNAMFVITLFIESRIGSCLLYTSRCV